MWCVFVDETTMGAKELRESKSSFNGFFSTVENGASLSTLRNLFKLEGGCCQSCVCHYNYVFMYPVPFKCLTKVLHLLCFVIQYTLVVNQPLSVCARVPLFHIHLKLLHLFRSVKQSMCAALVRSLNVFGSHCSR